MDNLWWNQFLGVNLGAENNITNFNMAITNVSKENLCPLITGDQGNIWKYRKGKELVTLFQKYGFRNDVYNDGLPQLNSSTSKPSRTQYTKDRLFQLNDGQLRALIMEIIHDSTDTDKAIEEINYILQQDGVKLICGDNHEEAKWEGVIVDRQIQNLASFQENEKKVIDAIKSARVSILVAMAWFTNSIIKEALEQKRLEGLRIEIVVFKDGVNATCGVDLSSFDQKEIRGTRGGIMHNKFCVIDTQIVITGSYNWSANAEYRNDENVFITSDHESAVDYSIEFRKLKPLL